MGGLRPYDNMGRLIGTTTQYSFLPGVNFTSSYTYDAASNRTGYTAPDGSTTTYQYDTVNRLTGLTNSWAGSFGLTYDQLSRRTQLARPNAVSTSYQYDSLSRLLSVLHQVGGTAIDGASYTHDNTGNRTSKQNWLNGLTENYSYDLIYQLTQVVQGGNTTESYSYDLVGNRLSSLGLSPYQYNSSNQLTSTPNATFAYDYNGNTTSKADANGTTGYAWDYENRLTSVTLPGTGGVVNFKYDPFGRRIQKSGPVGITNYVYDGANIVAEYDGASGLVADYCQGAGVDEPLAISRGGVLSFYHADGLGSVTSLTNAGGALAATYTYDAFGNVVNSAGDVVNPFRFTGREWDQESGLYYYRARYYDPSIGRFISEDPLRFGASTNFYGYLDNDPTSWLDPSGLCKVDVRYTPVKRLGITLGYHATIIVSDNTGGNSTPLFYRGQPSGDWWKPGTHLEGLSGFDVPDPKLNPDWDPQAPSQNVLDDCSPCNTITGKLDKYVLRINISNIPYRARTTNSNAFTSGALTDAGLPVPTPPNNLSAPGWGTPLPVVPLPVAPAPNH